MQGNHSFVFLWFLLLTAGLMTRYRCDGSLFSELVISSLHIGSISISQIGKFLFSNRQYAVYRYVNDGLPSNVACSVVVKVAAG